VPHDWWNAGPEEALVRVEIRPVARFEAFLKNAFGLAQDGMVNRRGMPDRAEEELGLHLHNWLEANVLRRKAEALIRPAEKR
jgi:hypothetical protein